MVVVFSLLGPVLFSSFVQYNPISCRSKFSMRLPIRSFCPRPVGQRRKKAKTQSEKNAETFPAIFRNRTRNLHFCIPTKCYLDLFCILRGLHTIVRLPGSSCVPDTERLPASITTGHGRPEKPSSDTAGPSTTGKCTRILILRRFKVSLPATVVFSTKVTIKDLTFSVVFNRTMRYDRECKHNIIRIGGLGRARRSIATIVCTLKNKKYAKKKKHILNAYKYRFNFKALYILKLFLFFTIVINCFFSFYTISS